MKRERKMKPKTIRRILYFFLLWASAFWLYFASAGRYSWLHSLSFLILLDCGGVFGVIAFIVFIVAFYESFRKYDLPTWRSKE